MAIITNTQRKTYFLLIPIVLCSSTGNVLLGKGMKQAGGINDWSPRSLAESFLRAFTSGWIWLGIVGLLLFLVSLMIVLSWADYSFVMPASSASYAVTTLMSRWVLREAVSVERWTGVALICLGVLLIARTPSSTGVNQPMRR